jgi:hypothetical protein
MQECNCLTQNAATSENPMGDSYHNPARSWLCAAVWSMVVGMVLIGCGMYVLRQHERKLAKMTTTPRPAELATEVSKIFPIVNVLFYAGVPLVAGGAMLSLPAAFFCFFSRK